MKLSLTPVRVRDLPHSFRVTPFSSFGWERSTNDICKGPEDDVSTLNAVTEATNLAEKISSIAPAKTVFKPPTRLTNWIMSSLGHFALTSAEHLIEG